MLRSLRYYISRLLVALTIPVMCYCISRMIPAGLAGNSAVVKRWFAALAVTVLIGVISFLAMTYSKVRLEEPETDEAEVLSASVNDLTRQQSSSEPVPPKPGEPPRKSS